jgi:hypothetical protein
MRESEVKELQWMLTILKLLLKKSKKRMVKSKNTRIPEMMSLMHLMTRLMQSEIRRTSFLKVRESEKKMLTTKRNKQEMRSSTISRDSCSMRKVNCKHSSQMPHIGMTKDWMLSWVTTSNTSRRLKNLERKLKRRSRQLKLSMTLLKPCTMSKVQPRNKENSTRESSRLLKNSMIDKVKPLDF